MTPTIGFQGQRYSGESAGFTFSSSVMIVLVTDDTTLSEEMPSPGITTETACLPTSMFSINTPQEISLLAPATATGPVAGLM